MAKTKDGGFIMDEYAITPYTICLDCEHLKGPTDSGWKCKAFPNGIPANVWKGIVNHEQPIDGDNGICYVEKEVVDEELPVLQFDEDN